MNQYQNDLLLMDEDEIYREAQRRIRECREKRGKKLDFSCLCLTKIPPEIAELESLEELNITNIDLREIPAFLGNIASLKKLSVGSECSGRYENEDVTLPSPPGNLRNLQNLSLGYGISAIPPWVFDMDKLQALSIYNDTAQTIPAHIANIKKLRKLRVYGDNITSLPQEIGERLALTVLDLKCPKLETLPESFAHLKTMQCIRLDSGNFTAIPDFICGWTKLEEIEINIEKKLPETNILTAHRFSPEEIEMSIEKVSQRSLTTLETIPKNIGNLQKLKRLILEAAGIVKIPDSLGNCPLQYLTLSGNFRTIPETFGNLSCLKMLYLSSGKPLTLPDSLGNLHALEKLEINAKKDIILPKTIGGLSALREIIIHSPEMQSIPNAIGACKNLKIMQLDSDKLTTLPESLCSLKKLEGLYLDTFALKRLPAAFGSLCSLKYVDILSGALTALPESMGSLKNLKSLSINAFNVKVLPSSFKLLSYVKRLEIEIGSEEPAHLRANKKKRGATCFSDLIGMNSLYRQRLLETYSIKEIESLMGSAPWGSTVSDEEKYLFHQLMLERQWRLNKKFKWTDENKKRMVTVSDAFLQAWEDGFAKVQKMIKALNPVRDDEYRVEIVQYPDIADFKEEGTYRDRIYSVITDYLYSDRKLSMCFHGLPAQREKKFRESIHISRKLSWNIEGLGDIELADSYICYALHILYSHNAWTFEDILKINNISTQIRISGDSGEF